MYSKRSPPTLPAGMELPYISMPASWGITPSTGINLLRKYSSMPGSTGVAIIRILCCLYLSCILEATRRHDLIIRKPASWPRTARLQELASFPTEPRGLPGLLQIGIAHGLVNERNGDFSPTIR